MVKDGVTGLSGKLVQQGEIFGRQVDVRRGQVLLQMRHGRCPGDQQGDGRRGQQLSSAVNRSRPAAAAGLLS
jgi:hypothetical protein